MSQRIVDVFETIQIEKNHGDGSILPASQGNRLIDPVVEQQAIGQIRNKIVLRGIRHLVRHGPRRAHIMENDHRSDDAACSVMDGGSGIFNRGFKSIATDEDAIYDQSHPPILFDGYLHRVPSDFARGAVNNSEDFGEGLACGFFAAPTGHGLCNEIEIGDFAGHVAADNGITNRVEGDQSAFFFYVQCILDRLVLDRVAQCAR